MNLDKDLAATDLVGPGVVLGRMGVAAGALADDREMDDPVWRIADSR